MTTLTEDLARDGIHRFAERVRSAEAAAIAGLRAYGAAAQQAQRLRDAAFRDGLLTFAARVAGAIVPDAQQRYADILAAWPEGSAAEQYAPSLLQAAELGLFAETRHSLLLAWLLDPERSGPLARVFWERFLAAVRERLDQSAAMDGAHRTRLARALSAWSEDRLDHLAVDPATHNREWRELDVFARAVRGGRYEFGLVIENKVRADTPEQPRQLQRYFEKVTREFEDRDVERTVFVFLTESGREPETAGETARFWHVLSWEDVTRALAAAAQDERVPLPYRILALQYRDVILAEILGRRTLGESIAPVRRLRVRFAGRGSADPVWRTSHAELCREWAQTHGRAR